MGNSKKVFGNMIWRFAERSGAQIVAFIVSIVLARLLSPKEYGTLALITVFTSISQVFVDSGLGTALIQKKDADELDFSTIFYSNIVLCAIIYGVLFWAAPYISMFYNDSSLVPMIRVLAITILASGIKNVEQAYVSKNLIFKKFFYSTLVGTITAAVCGIVMAYCGFGVWALVAQQIINVSIDTMILWFTVKWRPQKCFSFARLKELFSYGWKLLLSALLEAVYTDIRQLLIGKIYTKEDLAYYNQGNRFPAVLVGNINTSIDSVLLPVMSNAQDKKEVVKGMTRKAITTSIYVMAPLMIGMAVIAPDLIKILLTDKWLMCVPYLRVLCISYMFWPIHTANLNAIKAMGRSDIYLKLEIIKKCIGMALLIFTVHISVFAITCSLLLSNVISQVINTWPNRNLLNYTYLDQIKDIMPNLLLALIMGVGVYSISFINMNYIIRLVIQIIVGMFIYVLGSIVTKNEAFGYVLDILKNLKNGR